MTMPPPFELLDLADGESRSFAVLSAERGETEITLSDGSGRKVVPVLRLHLSQADKAFGPPYYDVTSRTLQAQLEPQLFASAYRPRVFTITKSGVAPAARFTVASRPVAQAVT